MKTSLAAATLLACLLLGARDLRAQAYGPYYYDPYWEYQQSLQWQQYLAYLQQNDPYYELHVMHYQLYLPPPPSYQLYEPCCYPGGVIILQQPVPVGSPPRPIMNPKLRAFIGARSQAAVSTLPRATGPLAPAIGRR
jgi:hypothetical protein